ncbi:MAG: hypothetical protein IPK05_19320 [Comamonadaceae bacterium]|nr:hypothetical protein [Comamonadaceae bacterium]
MASSTSSAASSVNSVLTSGDTSGLAKARQRRLQGLWRTEEKQRTELLTDLMHFPFRVPRRVTKTPFGLQSNICSDPVNDRIQLEGFARQCFGFLREFRQQVKGKSAAEAMRLAQIQWARLHWRASNK